MRRHHFLIGEKPDPAAPIKVIWRSHQLEELIPGTVIAPFDDYELVWDSDCIPPSGLEPWRREGDELCDRVVQILDLKPGQDGLSKLLDHLEGEKPDPEVEQFWDEIAREPPEGITAFPPHATLTRDLTTPVATMKEHNRYPPPTVAQGQAVFWRYSAQIFSALLHFSLAGGFSANRVVNVLRETNYLTGESRDATYKRLLETTQAIMDYMNDLAPITGQGWKSAIRVRMLHSMVRVRIMGKKGTKNVYDVDEDGIPINQEDLIATLGSFAIAPLWSLQRMGFHLTMEEQSAYMAVWRHVGYYMGISPARLKHYYSDIHRCAKLFACNTMHLFSTDYFTDDYRTSHTYRLLSAVSDRPPRRPRIERSMATSRFLLGPGLADRLALPPTAWSDTWRLKLNFALERLIHAFGDWYIPRWEIERIHVTRMLLLMIVCWQLGVRRTRFTIKAFQMDEDVAEMVKKQMKNGEKEELEKEKEKDPDDDDLDPEVVMGPVAGRAIMRRWKWMIGEMAAVVLGTAVAGAGIAWYGITHYL